MARRARRPCIEPGCPTLTEGTRCPAHARQVEQARGTRHQRGYDHRHEQWREAVLERDPICTYCHDAPSTEADHKIPVRAAPHLRLDVNNGRGACKSCHSAHGTKAPGVPMQRHSGTPSHPHPAPVLG